ncbi:MAG TPA: hypothetical protein VK277_08605 [Acidimicrobiales bacterium]|nr:hypothetical protein [Acidimicrobiales bacterium]
MCHEALSWSGRGDHSEPAVPPPPDGHGNIAPVLASQLCRESTLTSAAFVAWSDRLRPVWDPDGTDLRRVMQHRKMWEWLFICQALDEHSMLAPGRRGLGFGVGKEPLVALFASLGCQIVASDLDPDEAAAGGWAASGAEYAGGLTGLNDHGLCPSELFEERVAFRFVDMRQIPSDLAGFDFTWSSCAFEHLGTIEAGLEFVVDQVRCLRTGGVAVHTTEFNVSPGNGTITEGPTVLYRREHLEELAIRLRRLGCRITLDLTEGVAPADRHVDLPPFSETHLRTVLGEYATTSVALVIEKG